MLLVALILLGELVLNLSIVWFVPYTEIDWEAYMDEVEGVINGTYNYALLRGGTGPLVYPAGFVYIFIGFYYATDLGQDKFFAQHLFVVVYLGTLLVAATIYTRTQYKGWVIALLCFSYRIHSIFALRLFNDPIAMLLAYAAIHCFLSRRWTVGCTILSLAVSVKMNVLLFVPGLAVVLVMNVGWRKAVLLGVLFIAVQVGLGLPFLLDSPYAYIKGAFDLGRQFFYVWTVNWRCLPEKVFLDRRFQTALLSMHLSTLLAFCHWCWLRGRGGIPALFSKDSWSGGANAFSPTEIVRILFTSNFIGMVFSRSLHYQFYVWYFHTLPWLLWQTSAPMALRLTLLLSVEYCWNVFPSTAFSSGFLHVSHAVLLALLWRSPAWDGATQRGQKKVQ